MIASGKATRSRRAKATARAGSLGGRPSRAQAEKLGERILDAATTLFLAHGYGATSIEEVARRARVSKRTFYHRFDDKPALFGAVVHRIVERLRPPGGVPVVEVRALDDGNPAGRARTSRRSWKGSPSSSSMRPFPRRASPCTG